MEKYYAFIKDNRVVNVAVFVEQNDELANSIVEQNGYDAAIWTGENSPALYSYYDGNTFTDPTNEYLISIGIMNPPIEVTE